MFVGVDIVENDRFAQVLERRPRLAERVFTAQERSYCLSRANPARHFAARFAAKEAVGKALGTGVLSWQDIEITIAEGRPKVSVSGTMKRAAAKTGVGSISVSLSHCGSMSVAVAVAI